MRINRGPSEFGVKPRLSLVCNPDSEPSSTRIPMNLTLSVYIYSLDNMVCAIGLIEGLKNRGVKPWGALGYNLDSKHLNSTGTKQFTNPSLIANF